MHWSNKNYKGSREEIPNYVWAKKRKQGIITIKKKDWTVRASIRIRQS